MEVQAVKRIDGFMRGVNLGGWMSHEHHDPEHIARYITEEDFARIAAMGADHVRIPVDFEVFAATADGSEPVGYVYLDKAVAWCAKHGLHLMLDLHKAEGFSYEAMFNESGLFESEELQQRFYALWDTFARRYAGDGELVAFELLNEVTDPEVMPTWNRMATETMRRIRAIAPKNWILVGSYWNNSLDALPALELPPDDRLAYVFHCYDPFMFTHQGAYWVTTMPRDYRISYPRSEGEYAVEAEKIGQDCAGDRNETKLVDSGYFYRRFERMVRLCEERGVSMCCTEYGVIEQAQDADVLQWYRDIHAAFDALQIGRTAWSYKDMNFGLIDRPAIVDELAKNL